MFTSLVSCGQFNKTFTLVLTSVATGLKTATALVNHTCESFIELPPD